jgi:immune inhibitor A
MSSKVLRLVLFAALAALVVVPVAGAALVRSSGAADTAANGTKAAKNDNRQTSLDVKKAALLQNALQKKLKGKAYGKVGEVARGQYVQLAHEGQGAIWTLLGEFSDVKHNQLPEPDRAVDNTTYWVPDFSRDFFNQLLYSQTPGDNSMANFYREQSSGRYTVVGNTDGWVGVPGTLVDYDDSPDSNVWTFLADSVNVWYADQIAAGKTAAQIDAYLSQFDVSDRYDYDADGNFNEPDGYIDTFQSVHAGLGEEGGGAPETIWSHSWYANYQDMGVTGPDFNKLGGLQVGNSSFWVGKYTIQPENGGLGVFAHEYAHDMGLPDLYDYYGENGTGFWTLMSSGSWLDEGKDTIGNKPNHMGAWEKFQLGWLNYEVARAGVKSQHKLGPMEFNTKQAQGVFVILPKKEVTSHIADPYAGGSFYYSGQGDDLNNRMTKSFTLAAGATLSAKVNYDIEVDYDYATLIASTDGGATWQAVPTNLSTSTVDPAGIDGSTDGNWVDLTADLSAYTGNVMLGFRYFTDGGVALTGFMVDDIAITGYAIDGAETDAGWTYAPATGFRVTSGTESALFNQYYVAEYRTYKGYDRGLKVGPYFFGYANDPMLANWVDHFAYQDGLLINYWDTSQLDNNTGNHPGQGQVLPVDAHPKALVRVDGKIWRNRIQTYDSTFTLTRTDGIPGIHVNSVLSPVPSLAAVSVFNDTKSWYDPANPLGSVITPNTNTKITVSSISAIDGFMQIQVAPAK